MLHVTILGVSTVSLRSCIVQYLVYRGLACMECLLLTVMSFDHYLAICNVLHCITIIDLKLCLYLVLCSWLLGFAATLLVLIMQTLCIYSKVPGVCPIQSSDISTIQVHHRHLPPCRCMYLMVHCLPCMRCPHDMKKVVSLMYTVVTPLLNPIIYTLRNQEI
ncbi:hypothetical protein AB205_0128370, partial [Aquarana catesbeiana]